MDGDQPLSHEHTPLITSVTLSIISQALKEVKHPQNSTFAVLGGGKLEGDLQGWDGSQSRAQLTPTSKVR